MGAILNPFASPEASKFIEELQVWTGLKEEFLNIVPNAASSPKGMQVQPINT
jgi:hypothetical protein